jgi:hypothetical protein
VLVSGFRLRHESVRSALSAITGHAERNKSGGLFHAAPTKGAALRLK